MANVNVHLHVGRGEPGPISGTALRDAAGLASAHLLGPAALQAELERLLAAAAQSSSVFDDQFEGAVNALVASAQLIGRMAEALCDERGGRVEPQHMVSEVYDSLTRPARA